MENHFLPTILLYQGSIFPYYSEGFYIFGVNFIFILLQNFYV